MTTRHIFDRYSDFRIFNKHAFTLIELLVVIAVLAILVSLLNRSLSSLLVSSHHVVCKKNINNTLVGTFSYLEDNNNGFPSTSHIKDVDKYRIYPWIRWQMMGRSDFFEMVPTSAPKTTFHCPFDEHLYGENTKVIDATFAQNIPRHLNASLVPTVFDQKNNYSYYWTAKMHMQMLLNWSNAAISFKNYNVQDVIHPSKLIPLTCQVDRPISNRYSEGWNRGFMDGHVEFIEHIFILHPHLDPVIKLDRTSEQPTGSFDGIKGKDIR